MPISKKDVTFFDRDLIPESIDDVLNVHAEIWKEKLRASLQANNRVATGSLQSSLVAVIDSTPNNLSISILSNKYGKFVDKGVSGTQVKYDTPKPQNPDVRLFKLFSIKLLKMHSKPSAEVLNKNQ